MKNIHEGPMDMDNGEETNYGSGGWAGWRRATGKKWVNCNSISNKIFKKNKRIFDYDRAMFSVFYFLPSTCCSLNCLWCIFLYEQM